MTALSSHIAAFADRWPKFLALLLGAVSATGFAPLDLWPLTLLSLAGWMALVALWMLALSLAPARRAVAAVAAVALIGAAALGSL